MSKELKAEFGDRLVTLNNGSQGLRSGLSAEVRMPEGDEFAGLPIVDFIASNATIDRYDEIVDPAGWELVNYRRNPVFQDSHKYWSITFTLGKSLVTEVRGDHLFQRILFAVDVNPLAELAYQLYKGKFLNAVSVGFIPIEWVRGDNQSDFYRKFIKQELLELSAVSVPANPDALALGVKSGALDKSVIKECSGLLKALCKDQEFGGQAAGGSDSREKGSLGDVSQLLKLARDIEAVHKKM